nr:immunoglobulin light chain junction region [Macaca mulatta]MOW07822.1 immunoglobulin light chain junction region [Macaca mulatta]
DYYCSAWDNGLKTVLF